MASQHLRQPRLTTKGAATRSRIVDAAADLMYVQGVANTNLDEVIAASATSKSQLYHYFADKDALVREVIRRQTERLLAGQEPDLHRLDSMAGLRRWRNGIVERTRLGGCLGGCPLGSLASELADQSERTRELLAHCFEIWESYLRQGLRTMRDRGRLTGAEPDDLATALLAAVQGGLLLAQACRDTRPLELALDMALAHVERHCGVNK
jgi:TetR/AcrR family transcriptional regulator, transcriptional repressor for nem operon